MRKIIIFSEHRDTLNYLHQKIAGVLGSHDAIVVIHGGVHRDDRRKPQEQESLSPERLFAVKEEMEKAEARRLQPYFVRSFFMKGVEALGGSIYPRELNRFEIAHVPAVLRERDRVIIGRNRRDLAPVLKRPSASASPEKPSARWNGPASPLPA
jgi:hypothetical protein